MKSKMILAAVMMACSSGAVMASDLTMSTKTSARGEAPVLSTSYMTSTAGRTNSPGLKMDIVQDYQKGITYIINNEAKTITYIKLADLPGFGAFVAAHTPKSKQMAGFNAGINDLYGDPAVFKVENSGTETVMGRSCTKTRITSGNLVWEYSMDRSLRLPIDPATVLKMTRASYGSLAQYPKAAKIMSNMMEATSKLVGVALKTRMSGYNGETVTEVTSVSSNAIPASIFALPAGYTMKDQIAESKKAMEAKH